MSARAVRDSEYKQVRQPLSGYHLGYERKDCWRVRMTIGRRSFLSTEVYANEASAKAAARNLNVQTTPPRNAS